MLKELAEYYDCLSVRTDEEDFVPDGYTRVPNVAYKIVLTQEGLLKAILPNTHSVTDGKKQKEVGWDEVFPFRYSVSGISAETIEHRGKYLFGMEWDKNAEGFVSVPNDLAAFRKCREKNVEFLEGLSSCAAKAFLAFLKGWVPEAEHENSVLLGLGKDFNSAKFLIVLEGGEEREKALNYDCEVKCKWERQWASRIDGQKDAVWGQCAISGERKPLARIHNNLTGIGGGLATGVNLVCFKTSAFWSYGKEQSYNSSVSQEAMEKYTKAFNYLSSSKSHKRMMDGITLLFWANTKNSEEAYLQAFTRSVLETERETESIAEGLTQGKISDWRAIVDEDTPFYVLGVKPNSSRLSIKIFEKDSFGSFMEHAEAHRRDLSFSEDDRQLSISRILHELKSPHTEKDEAPPDLFAKLLMAILRGTAYPDYLLQTLVRRCKTDRDEKEKKIVAVNRARVRIIKACLVRSKYYKGDEFMLESKIHDSAYQCGRLFAVLERIQTRALGDVNATIKDKFFASACNTPNLVFPRLLKLAQPHLKKLEGESVYFEKLLQEILAAVEAFPQTLSLPRQGDFMLGYYQQRQKFYEKNNKEI